MPTDYVRVLNDDFTASNIHIQTFYEELLEESLPAIIGIYRDGDAITVRFVTELNPAQLITFDSVITSYEYIRVDNLFAIIKDIKPVGTHAGSATAGVWTTRELNTLEGNQTFVSTSNNQIVFNSDASSYSISVIASAFNVGNHQIRLYDITNSQVVSYGTCALSNHNVMTNSQIDTIITKDNTELILEVQHMVGITNTNPNAFGVASAFNSEEIFLVVTIQRL